LAELFAALDLDDAGDDNEDFDRSALKRAYRELSVKYHPDKNPASAARFNGVRDAYEILNDPVKALLYDTGGNELVKKFERGGEDLERTEDVDLHIDVGLEDVYVGTTRHVDLERRIVCKSCRLQPQLPRCRRCSWCPDEIEHRQVWANQCGDGHDTNRKSPDFEGVNGQGQNAASFWTTSDQPGQLHQSGNFADFRQAAVQQWYEEVRDLPEDATLESYGDDSFGDKTTGHYTQVVWAETKMVGCGAISFKEKLNGKEYFAKRYVCNYYPPGNSLGNPVYIETEGEAGEACPNGTENGLCL